MTELNNSKIINIATNRYNSRKKKPATINEVFKHFDSSRIHIKKKNTKVIVNLLFFFT